MTSGLSFRASAVPGVDWWTISRSLWLTDMSECKTEFSESGSGLVSRKAKVPQFMGRVTHGLRASNSFLFPSEKRPFRTLRRALVGELAPSGTLEMFLVSKLALALVRLGRGWRLETGLLAGAAAAETRRWAEGQAAKIMKDMPWGSAPLVDMELERNLKGWRGEKARELLPRVEAADATLGAEIIQAAQGATGSGRLAIVLRYTAAIERSVRRDLAMLLDLQERRRKTGTP